MLPIAWFVMIVGVWVLWRIAAWVERLLVAQRSRGWRALLALAGVAYALPAVVRGNRWAVPVVLLAVDASIGLVPAIRWPKIVRRRPPVVAALGGAEVIPLRPR